MSSNKLSIISLSSMGFTRQPMPSSVLATFDEDLRNEEAIGYEEAFPLTKYLIRRFPRVLLDSTENKKTLLQYAIYKGRVDFLLMLDLLVKDKELDKSIVRAAALAPKRGSQDKPFHAFNIALRDKRTECLR